MQHLIFSITTQPDNALAWLWLCTALLNALNGTFNFRNESLLLILAASEYEPSSLN